MFKLLLIISVVFGLAYVTFSNKAVAANEGASMDEDTREVSA